MAKKTTDEELEDQARQALLDYFTDIDPSDQVLAKARIAQATYGAVQKKRQTEGARDALRWMMVRESASPEQVKQYVTTNAGVPLLATLDATA